MELEQINYLLIKKQYWDLIIFFRKQEQNDHTKQCIANLEKGWSEVEEKYKTLI